MGLPHSKALRAPLRHRLRATIDGEREYDRYKKSRPDDEPGTACCESWRDGQPSRLGDLGAPTLRLGDGLRHRTDVRDPLAQCRGWRGLRKCGLDGFRELAGDPVIGPGSE